MAKRENIVLVGFMGTGKTSVGKLLSKKLGYKFIDIDETIEKSTGMKISEIFERFGENRFRQIESEIIKIVSKRKNVIISTGGGAVLKDENIEALKSSGIVFCLKASEEQIFERLKNTQDRPLLQVENPLDKIRELLSERKHRYELADVMIDTDGLSPDEVAEKIFKIYEDFCNGKTES